jgi:hypothetical protein
MTGFPDWAGVSPLSQANVIMLLINEQIQPGASFSQTQPILRQGYEIFLVLENATAGSVQTPVLVEVFWSDSSSGITTGYQRYWVYSANTGSQHQIVGHGPSNGNQVTLKVTNSSGAAPVLDLGACILDVSRPYLAHDWRTRDDLTPVYAGWTAASSDLGAGIVGAWAGLAVGGGLTVRQLLPLYTGGISIAASTTAGPQADLLYQTAGDLLIGTQQSVTQVVAPLGSPAFVAAWSPRVQMQAAWRNQGTAAQSIFGTITVAEQRQ